MKKILLLASILGTFIACKQTENKNTEATAVPQEVTTKKTPIKEKVLTKGDKIINGAIAAHGGKLYDNANYGFVFRKKMYTFKNDGGNYQYSLTKKEKDTKIYDVVTNGNFERVINGEKISVSEKDKNRYSESLNSVIYFATLPHKLNDAAVNKKFIESTTIKGLTYDVVQVTFNQEGGGTDFEDQYCYWINQKTKKIDYLAYNYKVNNGGVRFRSAYNQRVVDGITFQDYINWKAEVGTPLTKLPSLYEQGKLKELSRIETENVINLKK